KFKLPLTIEAGNSIVVKSQADGQISVARFSAHEADQRRTVANSVAEVIRAIAAVGGDYPDAVQALQEAEMQGALASRFEVDAIPERGRSYDRKTKTAGDSKDADSHGGKNGTAGKGDDRSGDGQLDSIEINQPLPELFGGSAPKVEEQHGKMRFADPEPDQESDGPPGKHSSDAKEPAPLNLDILGKK
ncbi:MAG TPA: hypothetical protein VGJ15_11670, partial [Pirellulales bacterium]